MTAKAATPNEFRNPSYKKTIWVSEISKGALISTKDIGGPRITDQPKTTIHLRDFDAHFCVLNFFHALGFSQGRLRSSLWKLHWGPKWRGTPIKWPSFCIVDISNLSFCTLIPPPKPMLHFKPSSLSSTTNNIDRIWGGGDGGLTALNRIVWNEWNCW